MSTTSSLGMTLVEGSDYISPDPFNDNFEILDDLGNCYITKKGTTSAGWFYRVWSNGRAECWLRAYDFGNLDVDLSMPKVTSSGNQSSTAGIYRTSLCSFGAFPITFASKPFVSITPLQGTLNSTGDGCPMWAAPKSGTVTASKPPSFRIYFFASIGSTVTKLKNVHAGVYACGSNS